MKRLAMAGVVVAAGLGALPAPAAAGVPVSGGVVIVAGGDRGYRGDRRGGGPAFRHGYDRGFREGSREGSNDGRRNRDPRFWREDEFRDADRGYKRWMGPRYVYEQGFREGYRLGYRRAYAGSRPSWRDRDRWDRDDRYGRGDERYRDRDDRYYRDERYPDRDDRTYGDEGDRDGRYRR